MLTEAISNATSPGSILAFTLGVLSTIGYYMYLKPWWCRRHGQKVQRVAIKLTNIIMAVAALAVMWTGVKYTQLATEVARCQQEFNQALRVRGEITQENDRLSIRQREALANWLNGLIFPPPPYDTMDPNDPRRVKYGLGITLEADRIIKSAQYEQRQNDFKRSQNPYPDPTCGRPT